MDTEQTIDLEYRPHAYQAEIHRAMAKHRFAVLVAHRRFGKTLCVIMQLIHRAAQCQREFPRYAYIAPRLKQAKQVAWLYLTTKAQKIPHTRINEGELYVELPNKARITLYGATDGNEEALRGLYMDGVVFDEFSQVKPNVWSEIVRPALADRQGWAMFIGTPHGIDTFHELYQFARSDPAWYDALHRVDETNLPWLPPEELELARRTMSDSAYRQEWLCVPRGAWVYTPRGQRHIETLKVGELVLSHSGRFRSIQKTYERPYVGELVEIRAYGEPARLRLTPEHPVRVADPVRQTFKWIPASEVTKEHWLVRPRRKPGPKVMSAELVEMLGWYICEGSTSKTGLNIAIGATEYEYADRIIKVIARLGVKAKQAVMNGVRQFTIGSAGLSDLCVEHCGKIAHRKRIPWTLIQGHERLLYDTLIRGDGCHFGDVDIYVTVSPHLARDVQMLAGMLGYRAGISRKKGGIDTIQGRTVNVRDKYEVRVSLTANKRAFTRTMKHGIATRVRSARRVPYEGTVHNLEVQTEHTYVVEGLTVHNCDWSASSADTLITIDLVSSSVQREYAHKDIYFAPVVIGVDVARFGDDRSVIQVRQGLRAFEPIVFRNIDNMALAGHVAETMQKFKPQAVFIDAGGGSGVIDRLRSIGHLGIIEVNFGGKALDDHYHDKRSEMWGETREWLEQGGQIENDVTLKSDLAAPTYEYTAAGKIRLESKDSMKSRGLPSPDMGDALALTFAMPVSSAIRDLHRQQEYAVMDDSGFS